MTEEQRKLIDVSKSVLDTVGDDIQILPPTDGVKRIVMKFGGSSIANPERITYVTKLIKKHVDMGYRPIIICSAMGKTTNTLVSAGDFALQGQVLVDSLRTMHIGTATALGLPESTLRSLSELLDNLERLLEGVKNIGELTPRTMDALISFGERMSIRIVAGNLNKLGVPAQPFDSWTLGMLTTSDFGNAEVLPESYANIGDNLRKFDGSIVPVITGFIGKDKEGRITTLGRGGSDLSATVVGAACPADEVQVWKDVDGIMTADPRLVKGALPVDAVTYEEAAELAFFGAEVLHPISMQPAIASKIPVRVKNSYNPMAVGTVISASRDKTGTLVTAITSKNKVKLIDLVSTRMLGQYGFLAKVFSIFELCKASVDVVASSDVSLSLTLDTKGTADEAKLLALLKGIAQVEVFEERAIISLICNLDRSSEVMSIAFKVLEELGITVEMLSQGASKVNISLVVQMAQRERVIKALHARFFE
ncbi:aspartate kinase [Ochromonadaceae sp. CCMP2298]|nr:aspartate kinase [Ochromonadaceae sp. CCMP2298]